MTKYIFYFVILWISVLLFDLPVCNNLREFKNVAYIKNDDPIEHVEGLTYNRLTFLRGCLIKKQYFNMEGNHNTKCTAYNHTRYDDHSPDFLTYLPFQCNGNIFKCTSVKNFAISVKMNIHNQLYQLSTNEKYNIVNVKQLNNRSVTSMKYISKENTNSSKTCKCYCDDESKRETVRSFCQDIVETDSFLGYVLTGVRFKIIGRIVYLEVQQGKLINGSIDLNTIHWKNSQSCKYYGVLNYNHRSLQLDDILIPKGYVITGVMWIRYHKRIAYFGFNVGRLILGIKETKVDNYGNLVFKEWGIREKLSASRRQLHVFSDYILSSPTNKSQELSIPNKHYIKFRTTGWAKDFAQHVVPFIDLQEVVSNSSKPIIGMGVYYRSSYQYGGFIAPKLIVEN